MEISESMKKVIASCLAVNTKHSLPLYVIDVHVSSQWNMLTSCSSGKGRGEQIFL